MEVTLEPKTKDVFYAHGELMKIHVRALACHCECLGMNAENCVAACAGTAVPYPEFAYQASLLKWGLIDEEGKPIN